MPVRPAGLSAVALHSDMQLWYWSALDERVVDQSENITGKPQLIERAEHFLRSTRAAIVSMRQTEVASLRNKGHRSIDYEDECSLVRLTSKVGC